VPYRETGMMYGVKPHEKTFNTIVDVDILVSISSTPSWPLAP
jgi:hypothetical protein